MMLQRPARSAALLLASSMFTSPAFAAPPLATELVTRPLASPAAAWTYYGTSTTRTSGPMPQPTAAPELVSLAKGLGADRADLTAVQYARNVFDYVRNNIATELRFGLGKGGRGALIDQSGTPFDQAELMVKLLKQRAGLTATYKVGVIRLNAADFGRWTGFVKNLNQAAQAFDVDAQAACQMLADGGIPATITSSGGSGQTSCASVSGNLTTVDLGHIWVEYGGNLYDPSFKKHILYAPPDLAALAGCGTNAAPTCGTAATTALLSGAITSTIGTAPTVRNLNQTALATQLDGVATAIEASIRAQATEKSFSKFAGIPEIDLSFSPVVAASLPYVQTTQYTWNSDIPDQFRSKLRIVYDIIDRTLFVDELSGRRLYNSNSGDLYIEGNLINAGSPQQSTIDVNYSIYATMPFVFNSSETKYFTTRLLGGTTTVSIVPIWGRSNSSTAGFFNDLSLAKTNYYGNPAYPFVADDGFPLATTLYAQQDNGLKALSGLYQVALTRHYSVGLVEKSGGSRVSLASSVSANSVNNNAAARTSVFQTLAGMDATMESEFGNSYPEAGASGFFSFYNAQGIAFANLTAANIAGATPSLVDYSTDSIARLNAATSSAYSVITPVDGKAGCVPLPNWAPGPQVQACPFADTEPAINYKDSAMGYLIGQKWKGNAVSPPPVAVTTERKEYSFKQAKYATIDAARGAAVLRPAPDIVTGWGEYPYSLSFQRTFDTSSTGGTRYSFNPGSINTPPSNIATPVRSNKGANYLGIANAIDMGFFPNIPNYYTAVTEMRHNLEFEARISANPSIMAGQRSAIESSHFLSAIVTLRNLHSGGSFHNRLATAFTQDWLTTRFRESVVSISRGTSTESFVRLPSGLFFSSASPASRLTMTGTRTGPYAIGAYGGNQVAGVPLVGASSAKLFAYLDLQFQLVDGEGSSIGFDGTVPPNFVEVGFSKDGTTAMVVQETSPFGLRVGFDHLYTKLQFVRNSLGRVLNIGVHPSVWGSGPFTYAISSVSDENGRTVSYQQTAQYPNATFSVIRPNTPAEVYDFTAGSYSPDAADIGRARSRLRRWFTPLDPVTPFQTFVYDPMYRLVGKTDSRGSTISLFGGVSSNEESKVVSQKDASGNVSVTNFDDSNRVVSATDPLGRTTRNHYDDVGRLLRTVYPEGNAVEYTYDLRGNKLRECGIPKGAVNWSTLTALTEQVPQCNTARVPVADLATTTTYMEAANLRADQCVNSKTCNKPSHTIDPKGNRTTYTWDVTHGQLKSETSGLNAVGSCAVVGGVCPVTTYGYTGFAGVSGVGGTFYLLTSKVETISSGVTTTTSYEYDTANKFVLKSSVVDTGGLILRTCYKFDPAGNLISKTDPKAALASCP
jgi:YD repeat-containing protein